jgi:hypothetical protein
VILLLSFHTPFSPLSSTFSSSTLFSFPLFFFRFPSALPLFLLLTFLFFIFSLLILLLRLVLPLLHLLFLLHLHIFLFSFPIIPLPLLHSPSSCSILLQFLLWFLLLLRYSSSLVSPLSSCFLSFFSYFSSSRSTLLSSCPPLSYSLRPGLLITGCYKLRVGYMQSIRNNNFWWRAKFVLVFD